MGARRMPQRMGWLTRGTTQGTRGTIQGTRVLHRVLGVLHTGY